jgi:hypothetical protein
LCIITTEAPASIPLPEPLPASLPAPVLLDAALLDPVPDPCSLLDPLLPLCFELLPPPLALWPASCVPPLPPSLLVSELLLEPHAVTTAKTPSPR